jgi:uncharacterized delta-60 repeat protein
MWALLATPVVAQVTEEWFVQYDGPTSASDRVADMSVADDGGIFLVGVTNEGGSGYPDMLVAKYTEDGEPVWIRNWDGPANGSDYGVGVALDSQGNVYAAGYAYPDGTRYVLVKYDPDGNQLWQRIYQGSSGGGNIVYDLVVDDNDEIYLTGYTTQYSGPGDVMTLKYDPDGNLLWDRRYNGAYGGWDQGYAMAVDSSGDIVITGRTQTAQYDDDILIIKYDATGNLLWSRNYEGVGGWDLPAALALATDDSICIAGKGRQSENNDDLIVVKYDADGTFLWDYWYDGPDAEEDRAYAIVLDDQDTVYVAGLTANYSAGSGEDYLTVKIDADGSQHWVRVLSGEGNGWTGDWSASITLDDEGHVFVTGSMARVIGRRDDPPMESGIGTVSYDADGNQRWFMFRPGDADYSAGGHIVHAGADGSLVLAGYKWTQDAQGDFLLIGYQENRSDCNGNGLVDIDEIAVNPDLDLDGTGILDECEEQGDLDGDGLVAIGDLLTLLAVWGPCPAPPGACPADLDDNGSVDVVDLLAMLASWD